MKTLISCEVPSSAFEWGFKNQFEPNLCIELKQSNVEHKFQSLSFYEGETKAFPFPRSKEGIESLSKMGGMQFGFKYGEAYRLVRGSLS